MRLQSISYIENMDTPQEWRLESMQFGQQMLIVGRNAAGKSRALSVVASLARNLTGDLPPNMSGEYIATFDENGKEYIYELKFQDFIVKHERIIIDNYVYLERGNDGVGKIFAKFVENGKAIDFQVPSSSFAAVVKRDKIQHEFIEPLYEWASSLRFYQFGGIMQGALAVFAPIGRPINDRDQNAIAAIFREGSTLYKDAFTDSIKRDLAEIDYEIDSVELSTPISVRLSGVGTQPVSINVREKDLNGITDQIGMSTGMFRVLALLIHVNFAQFNGSASSVLIDDIGEGLDFERSCRLIKLLREKSYDYNFQLVMSTNDKFVMNNVPLEEWTVLHRSKNVVHVRNYENSRAAFDDFKFTGLSNFSFFEVNAVEMDFKGIDEGEDA
jgi:energy-coupling factor transporter ATP-binding protein EcfA2